MQTRVDLDKATERAWSVFEHDVARRIWQVDEYDGFSLAMQGPEREARPGTPYVHVFRDEEGVFAYVPRNQAVVERFQLTKAARRELRALGWARRDHDAPELRMHVENARESAEAITKVFRSVWGVPHPSFLIDSADLVPDVPEDSEDEPAKVRIGKRIAGPRPMRSTTAVEASHTDQLREYVDRTLSEDLGSPVAYDSDGDIPFRAGASVVFVRVPRSDRVEFFSEFVLDVHDLRMAAHEVHVLNRDTPFLKFLLLGDRIKMSFSLPAQPLAPAHVIEVLDIALKVAEETAPDVAFRVGGRCFLDFPATVPGEE